MLKKTNGECGIFKLLLDCMITNNIRNTSEINPELHGKSSIQQYENSFHQKRRIKFKEETNKLLHLEHIFVWYWNLHTSEIRSEIPGRV